VLNAEGQFGWPAYAGLLVPLCMALLTLLFSHAWGIAVLCVGMLVGTGLQLLAVVLRLTRARLRYHFVLDLDASLRQLWQVAWPVLMGALILQGGSLVDQIFASTLVAGSISACAYALKLVSLMIGVLFVSVGRAAFPHLARQANLVDPEFRAFKETLRLALWSVTLCTLTCSLALLLLGRPLVRLLFQHGAFTSTQAQTTALILSGFAPGLIPMAAGFLLTRAFNALGETRIPMLMALVSVMANALLDALFARLWQGPGIALATSAVSLLVTLLLLWLLRRRIGHLGLWQVPAKYALWRLTRALLAG